MREEVGRIVGFDSPEGGTSLPAGNPEGVALGSRGRQPNAIYFCQTVDLVGLGGIGWHEIYLPHRFGISRVPK